MARRTVSSSGHSPDSQRQEPQWPRGRSVRSAGSGNRAVRSRRDMPESPTRDNTAAVRDDEQPPTQSQSFEEYPKAMRGRQARSGRSAKAARSVRAGKERRVRGGQSRTVEPRTATSGTHDAERQSASGESTQVSSGPNDSAKRPRYRFRKLVRKRRRESERTARTAQSSQSKAVSAPGSFVDARALESEDLVARTLDESAGTIGVATRPKVVDFKERQRERKTANLRVLAMRIGIGAVVFALVIALIWLLFFSPALRLRQDRITVMGANEWVNRTQILDIAKQQAGKSLLIVSDKSVEQQLDDIPGVSSSRATKKFPNGLEVEVTAQRPAAMLKVAGKDGLTAVDNQTRVLNSVTNQAVKGIPVIEVKNIDDALGQRSVRAAVTILDAMPESWRTRVTAVSANTQDSVTTTLDNGITIVWGDSADLKLKMAIVDKIMNDPNVIGDKKQINVSAPGRPIIK